MLPENKRPQFDRKRMRAIDFGISKNILLTTLGQLLIFIVFALLGNNYYSHPKATMFFGLSILVMLVIQTFLFFQFDLLYGRGPRRWFKAYTVFYVVYLFIWSCFVIYMMGHMALTPSIYLLITFSLACAMMSSLFWEPYLLINRLNVLFYFISPGIMLLIYQDSSAFILGMLLISFSVVALKLVTAGYQRYWERIDKEIQLENATTDLKHALAEARRANSVKIDFLGNLTHEIRTPMNNILGMISLLSDTHLEKNQRDMLSVASQSSENLLALIDDILDFSKIASGSISLDSNVFNFRLCIEDIIEPLGPLAHDKQLEINTVFDKDMPLRVRSDSVRIGQITHNLVLNALKFSDEGEVVISVHLTRLSDLKGLLRIHVTDEGIGISQDQQARLFDAFHRTDTTDSKSSGGTGLGLAICKGLVERMEGQIGLISELGKGSTFWFTIPVRLSTQQKQVAMTKQRFFGCKALVINGANGMNQGLINDLALWDIQVDTIEGTDKALQLLRSSEREGVGYQLVLINLTLHYSGTYKLSTKIAEDPVLNKIKQIILISLECQGSEKALMHQQKFENIAYVIKPITRNGLIDALMQIFCDVKASKLNAIDPVADACAVDVGKGRILLVEDNKVNQMVAKGILKKLGYAVKIVENGAEALAILKDKGFDIILMDCQMPIMDGYETTRKIRSIEQEQRSAQIPIIAMTAYVMEGEVTKCLACGMDDFIAKPVNQDELSTKLRMWMEKINTVEDEGILRFSDKNQGREDPCDPRFADQAQDLESDEDEVQEKFTPVTEIPITPVIKKPSS